MVGTTWEGVCDFPDRAVPQAPEKLADPKFLLMLFMANPTEEDKQRLFKELTSLFSQATPPRPPAHQPSRVLPPRLPSLLSVLTTFMC